MKSRLVHPFSVKLGVVSLKEINLWSMPGSLPCWKNPHRPSLQMKNFIRKIQWMISTRDFWCTETHKKWWKQSKTLLQIVLIFILSFDFKNLLKSSMKSHFFYLHLLEFTFHLIMNIKNEIQERWAKFLIIVFVLLDRNWIAIDIIFVVSNVCPRWHLTCGHQLLFNISSE